MKSYYFFTFSLLLAVAFASYTNTTQFWKTKLNQTDIHFQAFSGYEEIDWYYPRGQSNMFYQLFGAMGYQVNVSNPIVPLIIWLQGGPGSSSQFGAFTEMGPIRIENGVPKEFTFPWNVFGHMLFIDQPLNVGFSYNGDRKATKQVGSANEAALHLCNFLRNFYRQWPALRDSPLYITGQSFAGHYIPAFARTILLNETFIKETSVKLTGIAIGDGWTDPINQINYYDSYLYSAGIVSNKFRDVCTWFQTNAIINIYEDDFAKATTYFDFLTNNDTTAEAYWGGISIFNFRNYNPMDESFAKFLQDNKGALGIPSNINYIPGSDQVYNSFAPDITKSYAADVVIALRHVKVLIYNGQEDLVVNTAGVLQYINSLNWENLGSWKRAKKEVWRIHGQIKGWAKVSGRLWFALVNRAGHMVPTDQPEAAAILISKFIRDDRNWNQ